MASTTWTTTASTITDEFDDMRIYFHVDENGDPINPADEDPDPAVQLQNVARVSMRIKLSPDSVIENPVPVTRHYRLASAAVGGGVYGAEDGSDANNPAPITTGIASDLTALKQVVQRMKAQVRLDVNGDVEA